MKLRRRYLMSLLMTILLLSIAPSRAAVSNDELTPAEFSVLSSVINKRQPLQESDLNALRTMVKGYYARTKHYFTGQDVKSLTSSFITANGSVLHDATVHHLLHFEHPALKRPILGPHAAISSSRFSSSISSRSR